jgi:hypothetical protein
MHLHCTFTDVHIVTAALRSQKRTTLALELCYESTTLCMSKDRAATCSVLISSV